MRGQPGRKRVTSRAELEQTAFALFAERGFEQTTVDEIAAAAGIGRRTFFRYFPSKNDVPWGAFEVELDRMRVRLKACPPEVPLMDAIRVALIDFNRVAPAQVPAAPAADGADPAGARAARALDVAVHRLARRSSPSSSPSAPASRPDDLAPQAIAHAVLGVAVAAYEQWLDDASADLGTLLDDGMRRARRGVRRQPRLRLPVAVAGFSL